MSVRYDEVRIWCSKTYSGSCEVGNLLVAVWRDSFEVKGATLFDLVLGDANFGVIQHCDGNTAPQGDGKGILQHVLNADEFYTHLARRRCLHMRVQEG